MHASSWEKGSNYSTQLVLRARQTVPQFACSTDKHPEADYVDQRQHTKGKAEARSTLAADSLREQTLQYKGHDRPEVGDGEQARLAHSAQAVHRQLPLVPQVDVIPPVMHVTAYRDATQPQVSLCQICCARQPKQAR